MSETVSFTGYVEDFIVPTTGVYDITAAGAAGGTSSLGSAGGGGAELSGTFNLVEGQLIEIVVGGSGSDGSFGGGGGGGTYVGDLFGNSLMIAGGGGGGGGYASAGGGGTPDGPAVDTYHAGWQAEAGGGYGGGPLGGGGGGGAASAGSGAIFGAAGGTLVGLSSTTGGTGTGGLGTGGFGGGGGGGYGGGGGGGFSGGDGGGLNTGGTGGGSVDYGTPVLSEAGANDGNGFVTFQLLCYLKGTRILTPTGELPIERLSIGDRVVTRFGGVQTLRWIGRQSYEHGMLRERPSLTPVRITAGALGDGLPARDLYVTPGHSILLGGTLVLAKSLINGITITQTWAPRRIHYFQLVFDRHDCVRAEGAWSESFADIAGMRKQFHNIAQFDALYPDWPSPAELSLCAPRPLSGPGLDAALRPMVARVGRGLPLGAIEGYVDRFDGSDTITGWARDLKYPRLPMMIEVVAGDMVLGRTLACDERGDLTDAGKGPCGFQVVCPVNLGPKARAALRVRRASDHAELAMMPACRDSLGQQEPVRRDDHARRARLRIGGSMTLGPAPVQPQPLRRLKADRRFKPVVQGLSQRGHVEHPVAGIG